MTFGRPDRKCVGPSSVLQRLLALAYCAAVWCNGAAAATAGPAVPETLADARFLTSPGDQWKLVWHDEFDGEKVDPTKWSSGLPWEGDDGTHRHHNDLYASYIAD